MKQLFLFLAFTSLLTAGDNRSLLFHGNCVTCHHEQMSISAPSTNEIKKHYLQAFPQREDFVSFMSEWVLEPKEETSIMLDAIAKYELMPLLGFDKETLKDIAGYIYDTEFSKKHKSF
ncbi:MAG: cytochrome C [Helicobacteraceae bacterium]|nr:cytochrome C [Candidatus Sulfurimonas ponti]MBL6973593.1 cytochrome C [Sulfurimonas sp.]